MLKISKTYAEPFPDDYRFWEGVWQAEWLYKKDNDFIPISQTIHKVFPVLEGKVLIETAEETGEVENPQIISGLSLRYYNTSIGKWIMIQCWPGNNRNMMGTLSGKFDHKRCEMYNTYTIEEVKYLQKYTFSDISDDYFRWDRQVSTDEGKSWELTMKVHFSKLSHVENLTSDFDLFSYYKGALSEDIEPIIPAGEYGGILNMIGEGEKISVSVYNAIGGFGQLLLVQSQQGSESLYFLNYDTNNKRWNLIYIDHAEDAHSSYHLVGTDLIFSPSEQFNTLSSGTERGDTVQLRVSGTQLLINHKRIS